MTTSISLPEPFRRAITQVSGPALAGRTGQRFAGLYAAHALPANRTLRWHLQKQIMPGLALYQELRADGLTQADALDTIAQIFTLVSAHDRRQMQLLGRLPFAYLLLRLVIKPTMRQYPAPGWAIEWLENSPQAVRFNMKSCFYHNTLRAYGAAELTASYCAMDDFVYGEISPQILWQRTQTIGRGAELCNFCFARKQ
ncbi:MAG TPA: L-2-amino-thiazoline-4-carboxylic acid hydrolase [Anaerolineales bacterium]|nr:L-2-amino-thiazoline-4-carboxylic acid hydrolase [Anaerolineales bacterium]